jgi:hypothetical protein
VTVLPLTEAVGTGTAIDIPGTNDGTVSAGVTLGNTPGKLGGNYAHFNGANDSRITMPDNTSTRVYQQIITIAVWIKVTSQPGSFGGIIGGASDGFNFGVTSNMKLRVGRTNYGDAPESSFTLALDTWYLASVRINPNLTTGNVTYGIGNTFSTVNYSVSFSQTAGSTILGQQYSNVLKFIGDMSQFCMWNTWLTDALIDTLFNGVDGAGGEGYAYPWSTHTGGGSGGSTITSTVTTIGTRPKAIMLAGNFLSYKYIRRSSAPVVPENPPQDNFTGDVLYVDPKTPAQGGAGSDANNGLTPETPVLTLTRAAALLNNTFEFLALANAPHLGYMPISSLTRTVGSPLVITTWHKYGAGNSTIDGRKTLGTFNARGTNYWGIVDAQLPAGSPDPNTNYIDIESGTYAYYVTFMNGIYIDNTFYKLSKYPREKRYLKMEAKASDNSYLDDTDSTKAGGYWTGATLVTQAPTWIPVKVQVANYNGSRFTLSGVNDEEFVGITTNGLDGLKYFIVNHRNAARVNGQWYSKPAYDSLGIFYNGNINSHVVKAPVQDILLDIDASQYITIKNVDFIGSNKEHIRLHGCTGIVIDSCNFYDSPYAGIYSKTTNTLTVTHSNFIRSGDLGIGLNNNTTVRINNNTFRNIGTDETFGGDKNGVHFTGIQASLGHGVLEIKNNYFDSIAYCAIGIGNHTSTAHGQVKVYGNFLKNAMMMMSDGGGIYTFGTDEIYRKYIRKNIIINTYNNQAFHRDNTTETRGIYLDEGGMDNGVPKSNRNWIVDSNYIYKAPQLTFINSGSQYNIMRNNLLVDATFRTSNQSFGLRARQIGNMIDNTTLTRNSIVLSDSNSYGMYWSWATPFNNRGCVIDSNKYYNPFRETSSEVWLEYVTGLSERTLPYIRSVSSYEDNSTFNSTGWTFKDVSGITASQFIIFFYNWSATTHNFSLGSVTVKDLAGTNISTTLSVPAYSAKCVFYVSGTYNIPSTKYP